jgi:hypothetical protein
MNVKWGLFVFGEENQWWEESESRGWWRQLWSKYFIHMYEHRIMKPLKNVLKHMWVNAKTIKLNKQTKKIGQAGTQWLMPVILATQEDLEDHGSKPTWAK